MRYKFQFSRLGIYIPPSLKRSIRPRILFMLYFFIFRYIFYVSLPNFSDVAKLSPSKIFLRPNLSISEILFSPYLFFVAEIFFVSPYFFLVYLFWLRTFLYLLQTNIFYLVTHNRIRRVYRDVLECISPESVCFKIPPLYFLLNVDVGK